MKRQPPGPPVHIDASREAAASADPRVRAYQERQQQAQAGRYAAPRGGGPTPPLPPLELPAAKGQTIANQGHAAAHAAAHPPPPFPPMRGAPQAPPPPQQPPPAPAGPPAQGIQPGDMLTREAMSNPAFVPGNGSQYASNNPQLAAKYGVVRNGVHYLPGEIGLNPKSLSPDTVQALNAFAETAKQATSAEAAAERQAEAQAVPPVSEMPRTEMREAFDKIDALDVGTFRDMLVQDLLRSDDQRRIIEERLSPLDLGEYLMNGYVRQFIQVVPGKYEVEFKSLSVEEDLAIKRLVWKYHREHNDGLPDQFLYDLYSIMTNVCALWALNREQEPDHCDAHGRFSEDLFWKKFNRFWKKGFHLMVSLSVQFHWFDARVRKLFLAERIKNG